MYAPLAMTAVAAVQQLFSLLKPKGSPPASDSQATSNAPQAVHGRHPHHHKSIAEMISSLQSTIDDAAKTGKLTGSQATQMKTKIESITQTLNKSQAGSGAPMTPEDLQQIKTKLQEVRKELFDALNPQGAASPVSSGIGYNLFKTLDTNGDGVVNKNEFSTFISTVL
jgi:hypothetical protein